MLQAQVGAFYESNQLEQNPTFIYLVSKTPTKNSPGGASCMMYWFDSDWAFQVLHYSELLLTDLGFEFRAQLPTEVQEELKCYIKTDPNIKDYLGVLHLSPQAIQSLQHAIPNHQLIHSKTV